MNNQTLYIRGITIHTCNKIPSNYTLMEFEERLIKLGQCPFCFEEIKIMRRFIITTADGSKEVNEQWISIYYFPYWKAEQRLHSIDEHKITFDNCLKDWINMTGAEEIKE